MNLHVGYVQNFIFKKIGIINVQNNERVIRALKKCYLHEGIFF